MDIKYNVYMSSLRLFDNFAWHKWLCKVRAGRREDVPYSKLLSDNDCYPNDDIIGAYDTEEEAIEAAEKQFALMPKRVERFTSATVGSISVEKDCYDEDGWLCDWSDPIFYEETIIIPVEIAEEE